jgi:hypothetical protein
MVSQYDGKSQFMKYLTAGLNDHNERAGLVDG